MSLLTWRIVGSAKPTLYRRIAITPITPGLNKTLYSLGSRDYLVISGIQKRLLQGFLINPGPKGVEHMHLSLLPAGVGSRFSSLI